MSVRREINFDMKRLRASQTRLEYLDFHMPHSSTGVDNFKETERLGSSIAWEGWRVHPSRYILLLQISPILIATSVVLFPTVLEYVVAKIIIATKETYK